MPALGMAQETGTLLQWLKAPGDSVTKGEPLMEVETDKATVEVEAPISGILANVTARPGDVIPVGQTIAVILALGEGSPKADATIAQRMAAEHNLDLSQVKPQGGRVQKEDVLAYLAAQVPSRTLASPKARRLAQERGLELEAINGSGPEGAVLAADVLTMSPISHRVNGEESAEVSAVPEPETMTISRIWRVMAERLSQAWTTIPHFYLLREVNAGWRRRAPVSLKK
jgi:pyruvate dehydrogenase E2 component (dihydrolipoamide acetyltransferase)